MNTKAVLGWAVLVIIVGAGVYFFSQTSPLQVPQETATSTPAATTTAAVYQPSVAGAPAHAAPVVEIAPAQRVVIVPKIDIDETSLASTSTNPIITGTANIPTVGLVIFNSADVGIVGSWSIPVVDGHWSYAVPLALAPGNYVVKMVGASPEVKRTLVIK
jgi:hypothetical protein